MKKFFLFISLKLFFLLPLEGANLHSIIVGDVEDWSIGKAVSLDLQSIKTLSHEIALVTELDLKEKIFKKENFSLDKLTKYIEEMAVEEDDSILFYYSGHGYRIQEKETKWPVMAFRKERKGLDLYKVHEKLVAKKARLSISLSDCCNSFIKAESAPPFDGFLPLLTNMNEIKMKNYGKLFREAKGQIIIASSAIGEYSYCDTENGGWFTHALLNSIKEFSESDSAEQPWELLTSKTVTFLENFISKRSLSQGGSNIQQHPIYEIKS